MMAKDDMRYTAGQHIAYFRRLSVQYFLCWHVSQGWSVGTQYTVYKSWSTNAQLH